MSTHWINQSWIHQSADWTYAYVCVICKSDKHALCPPILFFVEMQKGRRKLPFSCRAGIPFGMADVVSYVVRKLQCTNKKQRYRMWAGNGWRERRLSVPDSSNQDLIIIPMLKKYGSHAISTLESLPVRSITILWLSNSEFLGKAHTSLVLKQLLNDLFSIHFLKSLSYRDMRYVLATRYKKSSQVPLQVPEVSYIDPFVSGIRNGLHFSVWIWEFTELEAVSWIEYNFTMNVPFPQNEEK